MDEKIEDLINKVEHKEKRKLIRISIVTIVAIILLIIVTIFIGSDLNQAEEISIENNVLKDSTTIYERKLDSLNRIEALLKAAEKNVHDFYEFSSTKYSDTIEYLLADTLNRYYLQENVTSKEIVSRIRNHLNKYPNEILLIKENLRSLYQPEDSSVTVFALLAYSRYGKNEREIIAEFKVNQLNKIFYVRNYESTHSVFAEYREYD